MDKKSFKSSFFGYSKLSVCKYIAEMNEQFNARIFSTEESYKKEIDELKSSLAACQAELDEYKKLHTDISAVLIETQNYAESLKEKAKQDHDRVVAENEVMRDELRRRLDAHAASVKSIKEHIAEILRDTDDKLSLAIDEADSLKKEFEEA